MISFYLQGLWEFYLYDRVRFTNKDDNSFYLQGCEFYLYDRVRFTNKDDKFLPAGIVRVLPVWQSEAYQQGW